MKISKLLVIRKIARIVIDKGSIFGPGYPLAGCGEEGGGDTSPGKLRKEE